MAKRAAVLALSFCVVDICIGQILTPPYFNLAEKRRITATATCGVGVTDPELFCKLVGANADRSININLIQGQVCDYCDPHDPSKMHPPEYATDGSERWWQSPPISRGMKYNEVNLTIDLGQLFQVAYIIIKMGNSPRPGVWALERSVDNGLTYTPWQYFADTPGDCERYFGSETLKTISNDDDVICVMHFSKVVPLEGGEIVVSLLNDRPSANNFFNSSALQNFTRATNVRLRLLRTKTLLAHLMSVARQDPTVTRRYFYSIKDISIGGRCVCNGHADVCDIADPEDPYKLHCRCQHHTCGARCETCCPGYIQKKWQPASYGHLFVCEPCNCFGHSNECTFDEDVDRRNESLDIYGSYEGGGVCQNCRHNTEGINCNKCKNGYYRSYDKRLNDTDVCKLCSCNYFAYTGNCADGTGQCECKEAFLPPFCDNCNEGYYDYPNCKPCDCHRVGTKDGVCHVNGEQCPCNVGFVGLNCDSCAEGFYNFSECSPCYCHMVGALEDICDLETGQCQCKTNFGGRICDRCKHGYYNYPNCDFCYCDPRGTMEDVCDKTTGKCICKPGYSSEKCDTNAPGFWGYPSVQECGCHERGSASTICDMSGDCACNIGFSGRACNQCSPGYHNFPECEPCNCDVYGSIGISCKDEGKCQCKMNFDGLKCDKCREGFYIFPYCEECNCDPTGVLETFAGCGSAPVGELCECKERVTGRICNTCRPLFWNLRQYNPLGCDECACNIPGTVGGLSVCHVESGQCMCKPRVTSRKCEECQDGSYALMEDNLFGCSDCNCNVGGSMDNTCDKMSGQCRCRPRITGQRCDEPLQLHFFPTLHQYTYESEDGRTPQQTPVRFGYDEQVFPEYSWRGYAIFSQLQKIILHDVYIEKPSLYRMVLYYRNPNNYTVTIKLKISPENPADSQQLVDIHLPPTNGPRLMTLVTHPSNLPVPLVMNPGNWVVTFENEHNLLLDYFVLLPLAYYEATILTENVTTPCQVGQSANFHCVHYGYPYLEDYDYVWGSAGFTNVNEERSEVNVFEDKKTLAELSTEPMAWLSADQPEIQYNIRLNKPGHYVLVLSYFTPTTSPASNVLVEASTTSWRQQGRAILYDCSYSWICRQVVMNISGEIANFNFDSNYVNLNLKVQNDDAARLSLSSIHAIPVDEWHYDLLVPKPVCIKEGSTCLQSTFALPPETTKVEFEMDNEGKVTFDSLPYTDNSSVLVYLNKSNSVVDVAGKLRSPGNYVMVVHYYQLHNPAFEMRVLIQNGVFYDAKLPVQHCPNIAGCRAPIVQDDGTSVFNILENFVLTLEEKADKEIWLDYLLVVPSELYTEDILVEQPIDLTKKFISECGQNHFYTDSSASGFCRDAIFALTMEHNSGALLCGCDFHGSLRFECEKFGGQCPCKESVIGRQCNRCKTGYYGFPDCEPCNCPLTALCDPVTGECICPPRVHGEKCERCIPYTYGFDPIIGCEECQCSPLGIRGGNLQCDLDTGNCFCKDNVVGRRCEKCAAGYWSFPFCQLCDCDVRGTEADICNQMLTISQDPSNDDDASCYCKLNVYGRSCDTCRPSTYNLQEGNPDGCTKCFCFGKTDNCASSNLFLNEITSTSNWTAQEIQVTRSVLNTKIIPESPFEYPNSVQVVYPAASEDSQVYVSSPDIYLGKKLTSYGGFLRYSILALSSGNAPQDAVVGDVVLVSKDTTAHFFISKSLSSTQVEEVEVQLTERNFKTTSGVPIPRDQFMTILKNLEALLIRVKYDKESGEGRLYNVTMDSGVSAPSFGYAAALSVELCQCPPNYQGSSCEECASGYYRTEAGPYGGFCVPCNCNGHAIDCDPNTGKCLNCKHNTVGDYCERCEAGYHGDATTGTPYDCLICACPLPSITNNFATSCEVWNEGSSISCECREGYMGARCERCAPGYFGEPEVLKSYCQRCQCNGNIDPNNPYSCDDISGRCILCLNNTYGESCERCAPGYYGDAVSLKNCHRCSCNECGTKNCQHYTGVCECQPNVIGNECDRCAPDYWGFASCQGCQTCQCGLASHSSQCDTSTGQCVCQSGVTGQQCDHCAPGFWKYTPGGCEECTCRVGFSIGVGCDPVTGRCSCLPGVIGDNCDRCPHRWVLIDGLGCQDCDECVHALLDSTDELDRIIAPAIDEFESVALSFFLHQRLGVINESVQELAPQIETLADSFNGRSPLQDLMESVFRDTLALATQGDLVQVSASEAAIASEVTLQEAEQVTKLGDESNELVREIVAGINRLVVGLETGTGAELAQAIHEAEAILENMKKADFSESRGDAELENEKAFEKLQEIQDLVKPIQEMIETLDTAATYTTALKGKLDEMKEHIESAQDKVQMAQRKLRDQRTFGLTLLNKKVSEASSQGKELSADLAKSHDANAKSQQNLNKATTNLETLDRDLDTLVVNKLKLNETLRNIAEGFKDSMLPMRKAEVHAIHLEERANELDGLLQDTRQLSRNAVAAANAYSDIVTKIEEAREAATAANESATKAIDLSAGISNNAVRSKEISNVKYDAAVLAVQKVDDDLRPQLAEAQGDVQVLRGMNKDTEFILTLIQKKLESGSFTSLAERAESMKDEAEEAKTEAEDVIQRTEDLGIQLANDDTKAIHLHRDVAEAKKAFQAAANEVKNVESKVPELEETAHKLSSLRSEIMEKGVNVGERLKALRQSIDKARALANKIKVGVDFPQDAIIEVKSPEDLHKASTSTQFSIYVKTDEPSGLILYIGTPKGGSQQMRRTKTDDFMALEVDGGYVRLTTDLGADPHSFENNKIFIADGMWRKVSVDRTGRIISLSVHQEDEDGKEKVETVQGVLPGSFSIFNLDSKVSKIYVGGIPAGVSVDPSIRSTSFYGQMEEFTFNKRPIGLWNFMSDGTDNIRGRGAKERNKLVNLTPSTGLRFDGYGYAALTTKGLEFEDRFVLAFDFKTYAEDGLMFLIDSGPDNFIGVEMVNGRVVFQYNLGSGLATFVSDKSYNTGSWHRVEVAREKRKGILKVDGEEGSESKAGESLGSNEFLAIVPDTMYFGGYPGDHDLGDSVTNEDFNGCIDRILMSNTVIDLSHSKDTLGTVPGCPVKVSSLVSFESNIPGFVQIPHPEGNGIQLVFKFKTQESNGLLFYVDSIDQENYLSLSLAEGALILRTSPDAELTTGAFNQYNDSEWHVVIATREHITLRLDIDDFETFSLDMPVSARAFDGSVFFGGVPDIYNIDSAASAVDTNFFGCIGDATLNGKVVNFAASVARPGALLEKCTLMPSAASVFKRPVLPEPEGEIDTSRVKESKEQEETKTITSSTSTTGFTATTGAIVAEQLNYCVLPVRPLIDTDIKPNSGVRFGNKQDSRTEFEKLPDEIRDDFKLSVEFKTSTDDGIMFYVSSQSHKDFIALYMKDGKIAFGYNPGSGPAVIRTHLSYNDNKWHTVIAERAAGVGVLYVDEEFVGNGTSHGASRYIETEPPYFYGGLSQKAVDMFRNNTEGIMFSFIGCMRNLKLNDKPVSGKRTVYTANRCSDKVEDGMFFGEGSRAHAILRNKFNVGREFDISMEVKPRTSSGVLMSVHGKRDFSMLQMIDGKIEFSMDNGKGIISSMFQFSSPFKICDGRWHTIHAIKSKNLAILTVDGLSSDPSSGSYAVTSADTKNFLFLGSQPKVTMRAGNATSEKFIGCIRNVVVNKEVVDLKYVPTVGNVNSGTCPTI